ncbi:hypothetical protein MRB53_014274 [Persea americana]|uniref:Uncharacterized protein n=1 Tax=Persea americana TaxID=3435 RepID=A0ACC2KAZ6_PERAE|nr:hypothetical protein MRB53_014274 [Persea americana]
MLSTVSPTSITRSSLEEMLESLRRRDEKPKDVPPALPARPISRARLPSARRSLPVNFKIANKRPEYLSNDSGRDEKKELGPAIEKESGFEGVILGIKKLKAEPPVESPYVRMAEMETCEERLEEPEDLDSGAVTSSSPPLIQERGWDDNVGYVLKKYELMCYF